MADSGVTSSRRSHNKSRNGCETCKSRHIRCDENFPQCHNCTKYSTCCPYTRIPATLRLNWAASPTSGCAGSTDRLDMIWTPQIEFEISEWQRTGNFPSPSLGIYPALTPSFYSVVDLRLIYHLASLHHQLTAMDANNVTLWMCHIPTLIRIGALAPHAMHALLAFSATHIAFLTGCCSVRNMALEHRGNALFGLYVAIDSFTKETSDAILATSLVLSWQADEWDSWTQLIQGTYTIIAAMDAWKHESLLADFIADSCTFPAVHPFLNSTHHYTQPRENSRPAP